MMDGKTLENQTAELDSSILKENSQETSKNGPAAAVRLCQINTSDRCCVARRVMLGYFPQAAAPKSTGTQSFSTLLPKALSAVLPGLHTEPQPGRDPGKRTPAANLEQLQLELRDLKDQFEQMKSQHKYGSVRKLSVRWWRVRLMWWLSCVAAKRSKCWWVSSTRRKGFAWLYRWWSDQT